MRATRFHLLHLLAGILIAVLLTLHLIATHLDSVLDFFGVEVSDPTSWTSMMDRASDAAWVGIYIALLAAGLYHALYGLRGIILELTPSARVARIVNWSFVIIGIAVFGWGTYVPIHLLST